MPCPPPRCYEVVVRVGSGRIPAPNTIHRRADWNDCGAAAATGRWRPPAREFHRRWPRAPPGTARIVLLADRLTVAATRSASRSPILRGNNDCPVNRVWTTKGVYMNSVIAEFSLRGWASCEHTNQLAVSHARPGRQCRRCSAPPWVRRSPVQSPQNDPGKQTGMNTTTDNLRRETIIAGPGECLKKLIAVVHPAFT